MKFRLSIVLLVFATNVNSQDIWLPNSHAWYGNAGAYKDSIGGENWKPYNGLMLGWEHRSLSSNKLLLPSDSNSYSQVEYWIGNRAGNANQQLLFKISRPISSEGQLEFGINRLSNAGWLSRSYVRQTDANLGFQYQITNNLALKLSGYTRTVDLEQNHGIIDSNQFSLLQSGATLGNNGNVRADQAFSRAQRHGLEFTPEYSVKQSQKLSIFLDGKSGVNFKSFRYSDPNPTLTAYSSFIDSIDKSQFNDSTILMECYVNPGLSMSGIVDSFRNYFLRASIKQSWFDLVNNDRMSSPINQSLILNGSFTNNRFLCRVKGQSFLQGLNKGDYNWQVSSFYKMWSRQDSTGDLLGSFDLYVSVGQNVITPALIYRNYRSTIRSISNSLSRINSSYYSAGTRFVNRGLSLRLEVKYSNVFNHVFFDEASTVNQVKRSIELYQGVAKVGLAKKWISFNTEFTYQFNNRAAEMPLPEWINRTRLQNHWPLFNQKARISYGIQSVFYSSYFSRGVLPHMSTLYVQNKYDFGDYFQLDGFLYLNIKSVRVGAILYNSLYGILNDNPLIAPYYVSIPRYASLNISWVFKN